MAYRTKRTYRRKPMAFKKKRIFKRKSKKIVRRKAYNQNFETKAEIRNDLLGANYTNGSEGVRAAIYWGSSPSADALAGGWSAGHLLSPYETYEWRYWAPKFEEYQLVGVKISATPGRQMGLPNNNNFSIQQT